MVGRFVQSLRKFTRSLSFKLSFYAGLIMFLALMAFTYHSIVTQERNAIDKMIQSALKDSEVIKAAVWEGMMTKDRRVIREIIKSIGMQLGFREINIYDRQGTLHYFSHEPTEETLVRAKADPLLKDLKTDTSVKHRISDDGRRLTVVNPLMNTASCSSAACHAHPQDHKVLGALAIKLPLDDLRKEIYGAARKTVIFAFLLFVGISTIIGLAVIFLVNPSIRRLQKQAAKAARGEYETTTTRSGFDEIDELSRSFDEMSRRVSERTTRLAAGRKMYKSLFDIVPCYLTVVNRDYRIVRGNKAFLAEFGAQVGKHCYVGYKDRDTKCADCPVEKTFADGLSHHSEETWKVHGQDAYIMVKTAPVFDDDGNIAEVLEMSLDVTQLKKLQVELEKRQKAYKNLFEKVPCYITVINSDYNIVQSNKLFDEHFGQKVGQKCFKVYKRTDHRCDNCPVEKTFADGLSHESEEVWLRNGEETHIIVNTAPLTNDKGEIWAVMEISTNVTEIKKLQSELAILGETVAGMSHTVKNILSGLQGGVYLTDSGLNSGREDRVRSGWDMVKRNVEKVSELVKEILYASKERAPEYAECDPGAILTEVCDLYQAQAEREGVLLVRNFDAQMALGLLDASRIHSALSNLVSNAIQACRAVPHHRDRRITVSGSLTNGVLTMKVEDDGIGMSQETKDKLFKQFYSTKGSKGTGLGLVITRKVVHEHGGTIQVESAFGKGTSFTIEIPFGLSDRKNALKAAGGVN